MKEEYSLEEKVNPEEIILKLKEIIQVLEAKLKSSEIK